MPEIKSYRDLRIWQLAMDLVPEIYHRLSRFPKQETYGLTDQIRRSAISIPANIAEGRSRRNTKEFQHFLCIARGSLAELDTLIELANRIGYLPADQHAALGRQINQLGRGVNALLTTLRAKTT